jgi:microcystin-dependent protein
MALTPVLGCVYMFAGNFAPRGYALCQGQILPIAQNTALFALLGTSYGGNGTTNFALPDLRGRFPVQQGQGAGLEPVLLGETGGFDTATVSQAQMPAHTHAMACDGNGAANTDPTNGFFGNEGVQVTPTYYSPGPANATMAPLALGVSGGSQPVSIQNPCLGITYIIATNGIFPSRN